MKRTTVILILLSLLLTPLTARPWLGGYTISFDGYSEDALASADEQIGIHLTLMPLQFGWFTPILSLGVLIPIFESSVGPLVEGSLSVPIFSTTNHHFASLFQRPSAWEPALQMSFLNTVRGAPRSTWAWSIHPFVFYFGEKRISLLAPRLLYETEESRFSWGVRLLEISHALY